MRVVKNDYGDDDDVDGSDWNRFDRKKSRLKSDKVFAAFPL